MGLCWGTDRDSALRYWLEGAFVAEASGAIARLACVVDVEGRSFLCIKEPRWRGQRSSSGPSPSDVHIFVEDLLKDGSRRSETARPIIYEWGAFVAR